MATDASRASARPTGATTRMITRVLGVAFLLLGAAGFVPGVTSHHDQLAFASPDSAALVLGLFQVSVLHNLVHLIFGVAGLWSARTHRGAATYLIVGGMIFLLLLFYGVVVPQDSRANLLALNAADDWLHLGLAVIMIAAGILTGQVPEPESADDQAPAP